MSRAIDADALIPKIKFIREAEHQVYGKDSWNFAGKCLAVIDNAPTIEPEQKKGKWIGGELGYCSCCGHKGCASDIWDGCDDGEFCPNCGADMRGEKDEHCS